MKHIGFIGILCVLSVLGCSKSKVQVQGGEEAPGVTVQADVNPVVPSVPVDSEVVVPKPETAKTESKALPELHIASLTVDAASLQKMAPEAAEKALLSGFHQVSEADAAQFQALKDRASIGDDRAKEEFVLAVLKAPHTHPEYPVAIRFLRTIREFRNPEAMLQRGLMEWQSAMGKPEGVERAKVYLKQALELNHQETLEFLLRNGIFGMRAEAFKRLNQIYEQKAASRDPKVLYEWARMMEFAPPEMQKVADALIQEAAQASYGPAMHAWSITLMAREGNWTQGYELLKKAAAAGSADANLQLATLYTIAHYADSLEMAHEMGGFSLTEAQFLELRNVLAATGDPKMHIVEHAVAAGGYDEACTLLLAIAANEDTAPSTLTARNAAIACIDKFVEAQPSRAACDRAYDQLTFAEHQDFDFTHVFSDAQRELMGRIVLKCYSLALERGENYPAEQPHVGFATALQMAVLFAGNHAVKIAPDVMRQLQYVTYAASHDDVLGQTMLAGYYAEGTGVAQNMKRACDWYGKAVNSEVCRVFCTQPEAAEMGTCQACVEAGKALEKCVP